MVILLALQSGEQLQLPRSTMCMPVRWQLKQDDRIEVRRLDEHLARVQFTNGRGDRSFIDDKLMPLENVRPGDVVIVDSGVPAPEPPLARCAYSLWTSVRVLPAR